MAGLAALTMLVTRAAPKDRSIPLVHASSMEKLAANAPPPIPPGTPERFIPQAAPPQPARPPPKSMPTPGVDPEFWKTFKPHCVQPSPLGVVALNPADHHLDFVIRDPPDGGHSLLSSLWCGCRASHGTKTGKVAYAVHVIQGTLARVGWGTASATLNLGNDEQSWGFGSTGKRSNQSQFIEYGRPWCGGDLITCLLDCTTGWISFMHNGRDLGVAYQVNDWLRGVPLFPHILTKNSELTLMFSGNPSLPALPAGYVWLEDHPGALPLPPGAPPTPEYGLTSSTVPTGETEVPFHGAVNLTGWCADQKRLIMLVGLPCSGKTFWAKKFIQQHPDLRFQLLSTNLIMERLMPNTVHSYADRYTRAMRTAGAHMDAQMELASTKTQNLIWDQTNVEGESRNRKLEIFRGFKKTAVVFLPTQQCIKDWRKKQFEQTGQRIPDRIVNLMQHSFVLPEMDDGAKWDEIVFAFGNSPTERRRIVAEYKVEASAWSFGDKRSNNSIPEDAPANKALRKDTYIKSYGELEFFASNPYRPTLPYGPDAQALAPEERQILLLRQAKMDAVPTFGPFPAPAALEAPAPQPAAAETPGTEPMGPQYEMVASSTGNQRARVAA
eukprot:TRINITY_DN14010_c0_g1_i1.p1 TRINITY_DN14010_c0_g1~~TRINITY_DN14010_c0_g1_i1.p1  ORF type:complete len:710 (-),score=235.87 TRINITY_DN14010_c0_g1_i1:342-2171(-)